MSLRLQRMGFTVSEGEPQGEVIQESTPKIESPKKKETKGKKRKGRRARVWGSAKKRNKPDAPLQEVSVNAVAEPQTTAVTK